MKLGDLLGMGKAKVREYERMKRALQQIERQLPHEGWVSSDPYATEVFTRVRALAGEGLGETEGGGG